MILRLLRDAMKLDNQRGHRIAMSVAFLILVGCSTLAVEGATLHSLRGHSDSVVMVLFLICAEVVLGRASVALDRGRLTLSALSLGPAALLLNLVDASIVGLLVAVRVARRGSWRMLTYGVLSAAYDGVAGLVAVNVFGGGDLSLVGRICVLFVLWVGSWLLLAISFRIYTGESIASIVRHNFTQSFYVAYGYFTLGSLLISYLLDGSLRGYLLTTIVWILAIALTDTIAGRRVRLVLESELSDADRHLFHSRAVEGVVHNLRNHMATAVGYLKEIDTKSLDPVDHDALETAKLAANDAVTVLQSLSQGATPRVTYAPEPVDLNELVTRAQDMARPRARAKRVELALRESPDEVKVRADPLLLREVITNLVNNAIDAAPDNGRVELKTGRRANGSLFFTVVDNGSGVAEENRRHLFEPHFTTKEHGTGLGLFMSYGIVREQQVQRLTQVREQTGDGRHRPIALCHLQLRAQARQRGSKPVQGGRELGVAARAG